MTTSRSPAIEVDDLTKTYDKVEAVRGVSFTVARGEVFGFLDPNRAGRSTTINMLGTLARTTAGTARVSEGCDALVATGVMPAGVWR
jgi:ABC-2 type transport system ATP-binding protein